MEISSAVDEYIKFMNFMLKADPVSSLQIAAIRKMSDSMRYIVLRGLELTASLQQAMTECKADDLKNECVRETVERRTGLDFETVMNGVKNLSTVATVLRCISRNSQQLVARATKYILLGEKREIRYDIGGWLGGRGLEISRLTRGSKE